MWLPAFVAKREPEFQQRAQLAVDTTLVCALHRDGTQVGRAVEGLDEDLLVSFGPGAK